MSHENTEYRPFSQDFQLWLACRFGREFEVSPREPQRVIRPHYLPRWVINRHDFRILPPNQVQGPEYSLWLLMKTSRSLMLISNTLQGLIVSRVH